MEYLEKIIIDNGTVFNNEIVKDLLKMHNINIRITTAYHRESNANEE